MDASEQGMVAADLGVPEMFNAAAHFVDRNIHEGRGAHVAIECRDERVTYGELFECVNRLGSALRQCLGVRTEERIVLLLQDGPAFAYAFFGAIKVGAVPIPLNTLWKPADYRFVLNDCRARVLVVSEPLLPKIARIPVSQLPHLEHVIVVGDGATDGRRIRFDDLLARGSARLDPEPTSRDAAAFWLYSSGSTGTPKGCVHLQHDMVVCAELFAKGVLGAGPADRFFSVAKLFFAYGLGNALYFPLAVGGTCILWPGPPAAEHVYATIEAHRPTLFFSVPTSYAMLLAHERASGEFDVSSVRLAVSAGEALPPALFERFKRRFGVEILDGIGSTEALHMFISNRPGVIRPGSSGLVVPGYEARILDDSHSPAAAGEIGNLWIKGDSVCSCYWNQHEKTKATIEGEWLRTGDKYWRDEDGFFWYAGRTDDMLKVGGLWVSPIDVENALVEHPAVQECGVVARPDRDALVKPAAFVVLRTGISGTDELVIELQQFVAARLAEYKRPRWVEFLSELPKTATGKIQRFRLRELAARQ
jgi:benzoate-CoA ligase